MYRLGAQGRALQQQLSQKPFTGQNSALPQRFSAQPDSDHDVQVLLSVLTSPASSTPPQQLLGYVAHYFPRLKLERDVQLLTRTLLNNPRLFDPTDFDSCYMVIEAIKATFDHKIRISQPSLPLTEFFHGFTTALYDHPAQDWKKVLVLTGILLSKPCFVDHCVPETRGYFEQCYERCTMLNHELLVRGFRSAALNPFEVNALMCVSLSCSLLSFTGSQKRKLPHDSILIQVVDLVFQSPLGLANIGDVQEMQLRPVVKHLSRLSFLVENCFVNGVKYPVMDGAMSVMLDFAHSFYGKVLPTIQDPQTWELLKSVLFGVVIMLQGFASYSLNLYNGLKTEEYANLSTKCIKVLFFLNFVLEKVGTGGFQAYNFVFLTTIDGLFQYSIRSAEDLGSFMVSYCALQQIPTNHYESSKALFTLNYFEQFTKTCPHNYHDTVITPFINHFINMPLPTTSPSLRPTHRALIEAAHSVVLATFTPRNAAIVAATATVYLHTVLSQFPACLSAHQLNVAVESIARAVAPPSEAYYLNRDNIREVLHTLYIAIINSSCSQLAEPGKTVRQALVEALIGTLAYVPIEMLEMWLCNAWELCQGDVKLEESLWKQISEGLDMQRGTVGIQWWYSRRDDLRTKL